MFSTRTLVGHQGYRRIAIFLDSQAALKALEGCLFTSRLVWEQTLCILSSRNTVHLEWIPRHKRFRGNEKADLLARKGALSNFNELSLTRDQESS